MKGPREGSSSRGDRMKNLSISFAADFQNLFSSFPPSPGSQRPWQ
jgi:hypothetical protein